jgi:hypothetical protein
MAMDQNRLMQQVTAVFSAFMALFYLGVGGYFLVASYLPVEKFLRFLVGSTFLVYGLYRGYMTFLKIREAFFSNDDDDDSGNRRNIFRSKYE